MIWLIEMPLVIVHGILTIKDIVVVQLHAMDIGFSSPQLGRRGDLLSLTWVVDNADSTRVIDLDNP